MSTKSALVKAEPASVLAAPTGDGATILAMIDRVVAMPDVPIQKIEQMFALYQKVEADRARRAYDDAFAGMQTDIPVVERKGKAHNGMYGRWEDIVERVAPVLSKHGFAISFRVNTLDKALQVTCILSHRDGHREDTSYTLPLDTSGNKTPIQSVGSTTSYAKRYLACAMLNIATRGEDNNGDATDGTITDEQQETLKALLEQANGHPGKFLEFAKSPSFAEIKARDFDRLVKTLKQKAAQQ